MINNILLSDVVVDPGKIIEEEVKANPVPFIIIGVVAAIIVAAAIFLIVRAVKKKNKNK